MLRAPRSPAASRHPGQTSQRTACPSFDSRQDAKAFNQPLSFDTSNVKDMSYMFGVRFRLPWPPACSWALPVRAACAAAGTTVAMCTGDGASLTLLPLWSVVDDHQSVVHLLLVTEEHALLRHRHPSDH